MCDDESARGRGRGNFIAMAEIADQTVAYIPDSNLTHTLTNPEFTAIIKKNNEQLNEMRKILTIIKQ